MSIVDKAIVNDTGFDHPVQSRFSADMSCHETGEVRPHTLSKNREYALTLKLQQTFWANKVQLPEAERLARKALTAQLYSDILQHLPPLLSAAFGSDYDEVIRIANAINAEIGV